MALVAAGGVEQQKVTVDDANAAWQLKRERRCDQKGRGSIYDSVAGIQYTACSNLMHCARAACHLNSVGFGKAS